MIDITNLKDKSPINFFKFDSINKIFTAVLIASVVLGIAAGFLLAGSNKSTSQIASNNLLNVPAKTASQDNRTFRDFAEGTIQKKPTPKNSDDYSSEGTHLLVRNGAVPVALTSSVVDLTQFEGKKVIVRGETQKAVKEGWLMDVGRVEVK